MSLPFDPTLSLGSIINFIMLLLIVGGYAIRLERRLNHIDKCIDKRAMDVANRAESMHAENRERLAVMEEKVGDLWYFFMKGRSRDGSPR